jgi:hypothetical protein
MLVSGSYFPVLGLAPPVDRLLTPEDDRAIGGSHVIVLSYTRPGAGRAGQQSGI